MNIENGKYIYGYDKKWSMWRRVHAQGVADLKVETMWEQL